MLRAASGSTRRPGVSLTRRERTARSGIGDQGDVGRGQGVLRQVRGGRGRLAADLEDVGDGEDENTNVARGRRFTFQRDCLREIYLRVFNSLERSNPAFLSRAWIDEIAALGSSLTPERILLLLYNFIPMKRAVTIKALYFLPACSILLFFLLDSFPEIRPERGRQGLVISFSSWPLDWP